MGGIPRAGELPASGSGSSATSLPAQLARSPLLTAPPATCATAPGRSQPSLVSFQSPLPLSLDFPGRWSLLALKPPSAAPPPRTLQTWLAPGSPHPRRPKGSPRWLQEKSAGFIPDETPDPTCRGPTPRPNFPAQPGPGPPSRSFLPGPRSSAPSGWLRTKASQTSGSRSLTFENAPSAAISSGDSRLPRSWSRGLHARSARVWTDSHSCLVISQLLPGHLCCVVGGGCP